MTRICQHCEANMTRPPHMGARDWLRRRFCSQKCRADSGFGARTGKTIKRVPDAPMADPLLSRMFGIYQRVARERGLNDVWEAAVLLGMAA